MQDFLQEFVPFWILHTVLTLIELSHMYIMTVFTGLSS